MRYLKDPNEPIKSIEKIRVSVRAILLNEKAELGYLYYQGQDLFGIRNHFESVGGGINPQESLIDALKREVKEETGFTIQDIDYLESIIDEYGKLNQVNVHHYFVCRIKKVGEKNLQGYEKELIQSLVFKSYKAWEKQFQRATVGVNTLVHQREKILLTKYINKLKEGERSESS